MYWSDKNKRFIDTIERINFIILAEIKTEHFI